MAKKILSSDTSEHLKQILEVTGRASLFSGQNLIVISEPGTGKSSLMYWMSRQVFGERFLPIYCTPTTSEEEILGYQNPEYLLNRSQAQAQGIPYWVIDNTPFDPNLPHIFLNEVSRMGDIGNDALIPAIDYGSQGFVSPKIREALRVLNGEWYPKTYWADSNWLTPTQRNAALRDRFGMTVWYTLPIVDIGRVMAKQEISSWTFDLPTLEEINQVREWCVEWMKDPEKSKAFKIIREALLEIQSVLDGKPFVINHRRVRQWQKVMFTMSAWAAGSPDFKALSTEAFEALSYCYPTGDPQHSFQWQSIVMAAVDAAATAIAELEAQAYQQWRQTYEGIKQERNPTVRQQRVTRELGALFQGFQEELQKRFPGDVRAQDCIGRMYTRYQKTLRGEEI